MRQSPIGRIMLLVLLIVASYSQDIGEGQNFINPTVVNNSNQIPASPIPVDTHPTQSPNANQQPSEGVLLSNAALHGVEGDAVPVDNAKIQEAINTPRPEITQEASARSKQQADRAKQLAQQARRQAQIDRKERQQREDEELRNIQVNQTMSKTQRKKQEERLIFRKIARTVEEGTKFTEYLFEQGLGSSQFFIKIPATQQVALNFYTYVAQENTYIRTKNIEEEEPVKIYIYENNQKVVFEGQFYYQTYIVFQGQANAMYLIRIVNNGRTKLISMNSKKLVEETHLSQTLQKSDGQHVERTQNLAIDINKWYQEFRKIRMLDFQDLKAVEGYIEKYYSWQIVETIIAIILCVLQVKMIQNMLKGSTIV